MHARLEVHRCHTVGGQRLATQDFDKAPTVRTASKIFGNIHVLVANMQIVGGIAEVKRVIKRNLKTLAEIIHDVNCAASTNRAATAGETGGRVVAELVDIRCDEGIEVCIRHAVNRIVWIAIDWQIKITLHVERANVERPALLRIESKQGVGARRTGVLEVRVLEA